jgi:ParB-like chromosome segregation protein Spo0J
MRKRSIRKLLSNIIDQAQRHIQVTYVPLSELKLDPRNPRKHSNKQIGQIGFSIHTFGCVVPVLIDTNKKIIAGHGRVLACQQLGWTEVPTITLEHLSEERARAFAIADNRLTENSVWDDRLLAEQLKSLSILDLDFDLEVTGFDIAELDLRIESLNADGLAKSMSTDVSNVDTIVRRWQTYTGEEAHHASSGKAFKELEEAK